MYVDAAFAGVSRMPGRPVIRTPRIAIAVIATVRKPRRAFICSLRAFEIPCCAEAADGRTKKWLSVGQYAIFSYRFRIVVHTLLFESGQAGNLHCVCHLCSCEYFWIN